MSPRERILHSILFEVGAVCVGILVMKFIMHEDFFASITLSLMLSGSAMVWNFIYNWGFDKIFPGDRLARKVWVRILNAVGMEAGLLLFTVPLIAWYLDLGFVEAFLLDITMTLIILVYTYIYNWVYDHVRVYFVKEENESEVAFDTV